MNHRALEHSGGNILLSISKELLVAKKQHNKNINPPPHSRSWLRLRIFLNGHGFIGYPKGRNVERALGFSLTGTVSTSPNLAKEGARSATIITRPSGSHFS